VAELDPDGAEAVARIVKVTWYDAAMLVHVRRWVDRPADAILHGGLSNLLLRCGNAADLEAVVARLQTQDLTPEHLEGVASGLLSLSLADGERQQAALERLVTWWGDPALCAVALQLLARHGGAEAVLLALVQAGVQEHPGQAEVLAGMLVPLMADLLQQQSDTVAVLRAHLGHEAPVVRWIAAEMLAASGDAEAGEAVALQAQQELVQPLAQRMAQLMEPSGAP
jgi:hypothetical protein